MFCPNCGTKLNGNEGFCSSCGAQISNGNINQNIEVSKATTTEQLTEKSEKIIKPIINGIKNFVSKYHKQCIIVLVIFLIIIAGILLFKQFFGFDKLEWDEEYGNTKLEYVMQSKIDIGVKFDNKEEIDKIKYSTTCGTVESNGLKAVWDLTESSGECTITASYKLRKINKKITIISSEKEKQDLLLNYEINLDSDEDLDLDTLTNKQEKEYGTDPTLSDTDMDNLDDYYEINTSKTDPLKADSDGDGLNDYDEIELGLNPLLADSSGDGIKDGERTLTYNHSTDNLKITITGTGNIASTLAEVSSNTKISGKTGMIDNLYTFYTDGNINQAVVTISYTDEELKQYGLTEDNLSLYYYNEAEGKYEKVETTVDKINKTITATLTHFSSYVVGDSSLVKETETNQVLFILDNSWSMYNNEQYKEITGEDYYGGIFASSILDGFDEEGVRFKLTSDLTTTLISKQYKVGLSEFRKDYKNAKPIGTPNDELQATLSSMYGNFITKDAGTNITNALNNGIQEFTEEADNKYIIILTDGQDSSLARNVNNIISKALDKNVKICSIGFGDSTHNIDLSSISNGTGCKFFSSSNADGLAELFDNMSTELNNGLVDINDDGISDGRLIADSGFIINRDGFSFANYSSNLTGGHCYGMASFAELYYMKKLPLSAGNLSGRGTQSYGYDLRKTYFENYSSLYDYKLKTNELKYCDYFGFEAVGEETPADLKVIENDTLTYSSKYKSAAQNSGLYDFLEQKSGLSKEAQLEKYGYTYTNTHLPRLNEDKMQTSIIHNDDLQMLNAIYAAFISQEVQTFYWSGANWWTIARDLTGIEDSISIGGIGHNGFINVLANRLNIGDPVVISSDFGGGFHAINAINLIQDIDNPFRYYIGVYDNNYPNQKKYVDLECNMLTCVAKENEHYTYGQTNIIRMTPSIEYDLAYYTN